MTGPPLSIEFVPTANRQLHIYYAQPKGLGAPGHGRFFVRAMVRGGSVLMGAIRSVPTLIRWWRFSS